MTTSMWTCLLATSLCLVYSHAMMAGSSSGDAFNAVPIDTSQGPSSSIGRCSMDDLVAGLSMRDLEALLARFAKSEGTTVVGVLKQLYSSLFASMKNRDLESEGMETMKLEALAMEEICSEGVPADRLSPRYQVNGARGSPSGFAPGTFEAGSNAFLPPNELAPMPPVRMMLRPPPGAKLVVTPSGLGEPKLPEVSLTVSPQMSLVEAVRKADYRMQRMVGSGPLLQLGFSTSLGCYIVRSVEDVKSNQERAWKVSVTDRYGKLVYSDVCLPLREDLTVQPRMTIALNYADMKRSIA
ncbi:uncharacterized protein LOC135370595 [Ornithodoros turicata]|uniref:uncharacterized protein LOC135370595 n=1 Tax=Ornithodoros turicata TaxID=34597 RepID=UPI00313A01E6